MRIHLASPVVALEPGQVLTLDDAAGTRIVARQGTVWVTEEGDRDDYIVAPGESLVVARDGLTLVQAFSPAWVALQ